jgi:hypothetical protein
MECDRSQHKLAHYQILTYVSQRTQPAVRMSNSLFGIFLDDCLGGAAGVFDMRFEITLFRQIKKKSGVGARTLSTTLSTERRMRCRGDRDSPLRPIGPEIRQLQACYRVRGMPSTCGTCRFAAQPELLRVLQNGGTPLECTHSDVFQRGHENGLRILFCPQITKWVSDGQPSCCVMASRVFA